jgi:hypothetical protein
MRHAFRFALALILIAPAVFAAPIPKGAGRSTGSEYFPLATGTKWTYKIGEIEATVTVTGTEKVKDEDCARVETTVGAESGIKTSEMFAVRGDGVYRVKVKDDLINPPVKLLPLPIKADASWEVESKIGTQVVKGTMTVKDTAAKVKTPHGEFEAVLVEGKDMDVAGAKTTVRVWFVKGHGIVKQEFTINGADPISLELAKFESGAESAVAPAPRPKPDK